MSLHRVTSDWGESTSFAGGSQGGGAPAATGDATWLHAFYPSAHWTPGGAFTPLTSGSVMVSTEGAYTWPSTQQLVADLQSFLDTPAANFGWILIGDESAASTSKRFSTREEPQAALRPLLTVEYTVPEPLTSVMLILGFSMLFISCPRSYGRRLPCRRAPPERSASHGTRKAPHDSRLMRSAGDDCIPVPIRC
jgi:hypothetical protein